MAPPFGEDWGTAMVTEDLLAEARTLGQLAEDYTREARSWTHPAARALLTQQALFVTDWAQEAAYVATTGDYWDRHQALQTALHRRAAAVATLGTWWERGQVWNEHRMPSRWRRSRGVR